MSSNRNASLQFLRVCLVSSSFQAFRPSFVMGRRSKRQNQLCKSIEKARESHKKQKVEEAAPPGPSSNSALDGEAAGGLVQSACTESDSTDMDDPCTFDPEQEMIENPELKLLDEWVVSLDRDDKVSLGLFLAHNLDSIYSHQSS